MKRMKIDDSFMICYTSDQWRQSPKNLVRRKIFQEAKYLDIGKTVYRGEESGQNEAALS